MRVSRQPKDYLIYIFIGLVLLLFMARNALSINIPTILILFVSVIPAFFATESQFLAMVLSFLPLGAGFQYKYAIMIYVLIGLIRFHRKISLNQMIIPIMLMMIWELLHGFSYSFSITEFFRDFAEMLFLVFLTFFRWDRINYRLISRILAISVVGICLVIIVTHISNGFGSMIDLFSQSADKFRFGQGTTEEGTQYGLNFNANQLGMICNMAISALLILIARQENSWVDNLLLVLCILFGLTTLSRTYVIVLLVILSAFVFSSSSSLKLKLRKIFLFLLSSIVVLFVLVEYAPFIIDNFISRNDSDDITNGRAFLMSFYNSHIFSCFKYFFFGIGLQGYGMKIIELYGSNILVCHNGIQEIWVTWGIVGIFLFTYFICSMVRMSSRWSNKRHFFAYLPALALLLSTMAGQLTSSETAMLSLSLVYIVLCLKWDKARL